jgi:hypothetical protein
MMKQSVIDKLAEFQTLDTLTIPQIRYVVKNVEGDPKLERKFSRLIVRSVRELNRIPANVQIELIDFSDKAVGAISELLHPSAQAHIVENYPDDLYLLIRKCLTFNVIDESLWKVLVKDLKEGDASLANAKIRKLLARKDCPEFFASAVRKLQKPVGDSVKTPDVNVRKAISAARTVKRTKE